MVCTLAMPVMAEGDNGTNNEAKVVNINGDETEYETLSKALSNAPAGSTVYLLKDVTLTDQNKAPRSKPPHHNSG